MSGTEVAYAAMRCYAMSGTAIAYAGVSGTAEVNAEGGTEIAYGAMRCVVLRQQCGTELAYAATSFVRVAVLRARMRLPVPGSTVSGSAGGQYRARLVRYRPARVLRDVR
eukprot:998019-Rhodomonas_salina.1